MHIRSQGLLPGRWPVDTDLKTNTSLSLNIQLQNKQFVSFPLVLCCAIVNKANICYSIGIGRNNRVIFVAIFVCPSQAYLNLSQVRLFLALASDNLKSLSFCHAVVTITGHIDSHSQDKTFHLDLDLDCGRRHVL